MYLGTPVMPDLNSLIITGLYINDLSMHDFSRYTTIATCCTFNTFIRFKLEGVPVNDRLVVNTYLRLMLWVYWGREI